MVNTSQGSEARGAEGDNVGRANGGRRAYRTLRQLLFNRADRKLQQKPADGYFSDPIGARLVGPCCFSLIPIIIAAGAG